MLHFKEMPSRVSTPCVRGGLPERCLAGHRSHDVSCLEGSFEFLPGHCHRAPSILRASASRGTIRPCAWIISGHRKKVPRIRRPEVTTESHTQAEVATDCYVLLSGRGFCNWCAFVEREREIEPGFHHLVAQRLRRRLRDERIRRRGFDLIGLAQGALDVAAQLAELR